MPVPQVPEGKRFALFKNPGVRTWSARIVMPDGHKEMIHTEKTRKTAAMAIVLGRVRALYKERGLKNPRQGANGLSPYQIRKRHELGLPPTATHKEVMEALAARRRDSTHGPKLGRPPKRLGRPPGNPLASAPAASVAATLAGFDAHDELLASKALLQMAMFFIPGTVSNDVILENVRAVLIQFIKRKTR